MSFLAHRMRQISSASDEPAFLSQTNYVIEDTEAGFTQSHTFQSGTSFAVLVLTSLTDDIVTLLTDRSLTVDGAACTAASRAGYSTASQGTHIFYLTNPSTGDIVLPAIAGASGTTHSLSVIEFEGSMGFGATIADNPNYNETPINNQLTTEYDGGGTSNATIVADDFVVVVGMYFFRDTADGSPLTAEANGTATLGTAVSTYLGDHAFGGGIFYRSALQVYKATGGGTASPVVTADAGQDADVYHYTTLSAFRKV